MTLTNNVVAAFLLYVLGHSIAWFQLNSQFVWDFWKDRPVLAIAIYSMPVGLSFWYATKLIYQETNDLWTGRFLAFACSYMVFPLFTWLFHGESPLTARTGICAALSFIIILVQFYWK